MIGLHTLISQVEKCDFGRSQSLYLLSSFPARRIDSLLKYGDVRKIWPPDRPSCILRGAVCEEEEEEEERRLEEYRAT